MTLLSLVLAASVVQVTGVIRGTIVDDRGAPVAGATVVFELQDDQPRRLATTSDGSGEYSQIGVPTGDYIVTAEKSGYRSASVRGTCSNGSDDRDQLPAD